MLARMTCQQNARKCGGEFQKFSLSLVESFSFNGIILTVIALDAVLIGIQASGYVAMKSGWYIQVVYQLFLAIYIVELILRMYAWRLQFFKNWWDDFSLFLIVIDLVGLCVPLIIQSAGIFDARVFTVLKVLKIVKGLRALRVIRTIRFLKNLNVIVLTLLESIPAIGAIVITISLVLYIFAVIGRDLYGAVDPGRYGNLGKAIFTLFQLITLDDWFQMYSDINPGQEHIIAFLILFIAIETLIFINLFVAVIVDNLARAQSTYDTMAHEGVHSKNDEAMDAAMEERLRHRRISADLLEQIRSGSDPILTANDLGKEYLMALTSLEHHYIMAHKHRKTLAKLVDIVDPSAN